MSKIAINYISKILFFKSKEPHPQIMLNKVSYGNMIAYVILNYQIIRYKNENACEKKFVFCC